MVRGRRPGRGQPKALTIEDDETQSYDLTTDDDDAKEGGDRSR